MNLSGGIGVAHQLVMRLRTSLTLHFAPFVILGVVAYLVVTPLMIELEVRLASAPKDLEVPPLRATRASSLDGPRLGTLFELPVTDTSIRPTTSSPAPFPARLLGTLLSSVRHRSVATLLMTSGKTLSVWERTVVLDAEVVSIERDAIVLRRGPALQRLTMREGLPVPSAPSPWVMPLPANEFVVSRAELLSQMSDLYGLSRAVHVVPAFRDGRTVGFRFMRVGPDSPAATLGLKSGDLIRAVNGQPLDSMQRLMSLVAALDRTSVIDLELERAGQLQTHHYRLN
jgi:general secretion pathway protein C